MGVRVKVGIEYKGNVANVIALVSTSYEGDVAEKLKIWPKLPEDTIIESYRAASGLMKVYRVRNAKVHLILKDLKTKHVNTYIAIAEYTDETLINDQLISKNIGVVMELLRSRINYV